MAQDGGVDPHGCSPPTVFRTGWRGLPGFILRIGTSDLIRTDTKQSCNPAAYDLRTVRYGLIYRLAMEAGGAHGEIRTHTPIRAPGSESGTSSVSSHAHMVGRAGFEPAMFPV